MTFFIPGRAIWRKAAPFMSLGLMILMLSLLTPYFLTVDNLLAIALQMSVVAVMAIGQMMVIISGGIDLSAGSVLALSGVVATMLMTAAGTVRPAKVFIMGAGVAGLQAIATARRLGAVVSANDIRPAVKEQVESLGAKFVQLELDTAAAEDMFAAGRYIYTVFLCHLAVEKALKAFYARKFRKNPPKIHNLNYFCEAAGLVLEKKMEDFIDNLNDLSVPVRYPDELDRLLREYTELHPKVKELDSEIYETRKMLEEEINEMLESGVEQDPFVKYKMLVNESLKLQLENESLRTRVKALKEMRTVSSDASTSSTVDPR